MINFALLSVPQLENITRTARNDTQRRLAQDELNQRSPQFSTAGTMPLFTKSKIENRNSKIQEASSRCP